MLVRNINNDNALRPIVNSEGPSSTTSSPLVFLIFSFMPFQYPLDCLFYFYGTISDAKMKKPSARTPLDHDNEPCIMVNDTWLVVVVKASHFCIRDGVRLIALLAYLYIQAVNPCLWQGIRFAHPCLCHRFKACWGLHPQTPGCIPTLVLAVLHPSIKCWLHYIPALSVGCTTSQH